MMIKHILAGLGILLYATSAAQHILAHSADTIHIPIKKIHIPSYSISHGFYMVGTDSQYKALQDQGETRYTFPAINFRKYMIMGVRMNEGCEALTFEQALYHVPSEKKIVFDLTVTQTGNCLLAKAGQYWIVVRKKRGYSCEFRHRVLKAE